MPFEYMSSPAVYFLMKLLHVDDPSKLSIFMKPGSPEVEICAEFTP